MIQHPLYSKILDYLQKKIESGEYAVGDRLPTERELADQFGVSRITTKKALELLTLRGYISRKPGRGTFVIRSSGEPLPQVDAGDVKLVQEAPLRLVGLVVPEMSETFGLELISSIERTAYQHDILLAICRSYGRQQDEERAMQRLLKLGVEGLIIFPVNGEIYNQEILRLSFEQFPMVLIDKYLPGIPVPAVATDNKTASYNLTMHLLELGHQRVAFFSPVIKGTVTLEGRFEGFVAAMQQFGLPMLPECILTNMQSDEPIVDDTKFDPERLETIHDYLMQHEDVTGIVATEFQVAAHVYQVAKSLGKRVPEDLSIACFDGPRVDVNGWHFTHIRQDESTIGQQAVNRLITRIDQQENASSEVEQFPARLVLGQSTTPPPANDKPL